MHEIKTGGQSMLIYNVIPLETQERVFIGITNRQLDLPVDLETYTTIISHIDA